MVVAEIVPADTAPSPAAPAARRRSPAELLALAGAVVPTIVMIVRAAASGWVPLFDAAYFTVRSRDVATSHNPLVGAWSMGSRGAGVWINNLGPLQLDVLAPFTKLDPYWGTALGVGVTNIAAITGVWLVSRRLFGVAGVAGAMAGSVLLQLDMGSLMLIEARQQLALVLPMWCLLWLAAAVWHGDRWAAPWLVFVASFVVQTHFTYVYQAAAVTVAASVALVWRARNRVGELVRVGAVSAVVTTVCWLPTLWDQLFGSGNLANVLRRDTGTQQPVGWSKGLRLLAETGFVPRLFVPGSMGDMLRRGSRPSLLTAVAALAVWTGLLVLVVIAARRARSPRVAMAGVALVVLAAGAYATSQIPPTEQFGIIAQNYYWAWPVGVFIATPIIGQAGAWVIGQLEGVITFRPVHSLTPWLVAGAVGAATIPLYRPTNQLPETSHEWDVAHTQARMLLDELDGALDDYDFDTPVLVDLGGARHVRYTMLAELQEHDIDFRFTPGSTNISRFGSGRCEDGTAAWLLTLRQGGDALSIDTAGTLLASVPGLSLDEARRSLDLATAFGAYLRDGTVTVDDDAVEWFGEEVPPALDDVRDTAGRDARGLSGFLDGFAYLGAVHVGEDVDDGEDPALRAELSEWAGLEDRADEDRMAIYLLPIVPSGVDDCDRIPPGYDYGVPID